MDGVFDDVIFGRTKFVGPRKQRSVVDEMTKARRKIENWPPALEEDARSVIMNGDTHAVDRPPPFA